VLGPVGPAFRFSGLVAATDDSQRKIRAMGAAYVSTGDGQPSSVRPELTGIAMALKDCPEGGNLNILTDSLSAMVLLQSM
jgi:hypothetical protein